MPSDFEQWPAAMRVMWRVILGSAAWRTSGWAHVTWHELGEAVARALTLPKKCPEATVRRWLTSLAERGEFVRRCFHRGEALPDGSRAWCDYWVVLPGEAMKAREGLRVTGGVIMDDHPPYQPLPPSPLATTEAFSAASGASAVSAPSPSGPGEARFKDSRLSSRSGSGSRSESLKLRSKLGGSGDEAKAPELAPPVRMLAERILRNYAAASGVRVLHFRAKSRALVAACLDEMEGDDAAKEMRIRAVIADAIADSHARGIAHPPLAYVFNVRHVRRRLERLAEAEHLTQKAQDADGDMFAAGFDGALAEARAELAAGGGAAALERARPFVEHRVVTDPARLAAFHELAAARRAGPGKPPANTRRPAPERAQDGPRKAPRASRRPDVHDAPGAASGPEDALRALAALFSQVPEPPVVPPAVAPLSAKERAELEAAQERARARWARAG